MGRLKKDINKLVVDFIRANPLSSSKEIFEGINDEVSYATVKRVLTILLDEHLIEASGKGKARKYTDKNTYSLISPINVGDYFKKETDKRKIHRNFNYSLIKETLYTAPLFTADELSLLNKLQKQYSKKIAALTKKEFNKDLEHLAIDLSWKSSEIEGNTYSLLETERLLKEKKTAANKTKDEAVMLLNHKDALDFIIVTPNFIKPLTLRSIEDIHSILIKELGVERNIRKRLVSIIGTNYKPLDNEYQIKEALEEMCLLVNKTENVFAKTLLVLVLISYIQPFMDGNKRTARIVSNAILMSNNYCPLSFRTVDPLDYKKAMLLFYEQNNISAFKKIFIEQFEFAIKTYFG